MVEAAVCFLEKDSPVGNLMQRATSGPGSCGHPKSCFQNLGSFCGCPHESFQKQEAPKETLIYWDPYLKDFQNGLLIFSKPPDTQSPASGKEKLWSLIIQGLNAYPRGA